MNEIHITFGIDSVLYMRILWINNYEERSGYVYYIVFCWLLTLMTLESEWVMTCVLLTRYFQSPFFSIKKPAIYFIIIAIDVVIIIYLLWVYRIVKLMETRMNLLVMQ